MKRLLFNLFIAALVLAGISFFAAPGVAFFALRSHAQSNDVQGLQSAMTEIAPDRSATGN